MASSISGQRDSHTIVMFSSHSPTAETRPTIAITTHRVKLSVSNGRGVRKRAFEDITDLPAIDESKFVGRTIIRDMLPIPSRAVVQGLGAFYPVRPRAGFWCSPRVPVGRKRVEVVGAALPKQNRPARSPPLFPMRAMMSGAGASPLASGCVRGLGTRRAADAGELDQPRECANRRPRRATLPLSTAAAMRGLRSVANELLTEFSEASFVENRINPNESGYGYVGSMRAAGNGVGR